MAVHGYIMVEGDIWLVTVERDRHTRTVKRRGRGMMGSHLLDIQAALERQENAPLIEEMRWGKRVALPVVKP